jgi:hypothetical protein
MTPPHSADQAPPRTAPFRWDGESIARAFDHFSDPGQPTSQRHYAHEQGVPRSTLGGWLRRADPEGVEPELAAFLRSSTGCRFQRRVLLALFLAFRLRGAAGLRLLALFLGLTQLDRFVAASLGALHELGQAIEADLATFAAEQRSRLAQSMPKKDIAVVADEHFHAGTPCLVALEPASNFILVEQYSQQRDADTWTKTLGQATADLPVTVCLLSSDRAKGLIACAEGGLEVPHLPELFHGQRDLGRPFGGPLRRQREAAERQVEEQQELARYWRERQDRAEAVPPRPGRPMDFSWRIDFADRQAQRGQEEVRACEKRQEQVRQGVRGVADAYHPFDARTGAPVKVEAMQERLGQRLQELEAVAQEGGLAGQAELALKRGRCWAAELVAALRWFWAVADAKVGGWTCRRERRARWRRSCWEGCTGSRRRGGDAARKSVGTGRSWRGDYSGRSGRRKADWRAWQKRRGRRWSGWAGRWWGCSRGRVRAWRGATGGCRCSSTGSAASAPAGSRG